MPKTAKLRRNPVIPTPMVSFVDTIAMKNNPPIHGVPTAREKIGDRVHPGLKSGATDSASLRDAISLQSAIFGRSVEFQFSSNSIYPVSY